MEPTIRQFSSIAKIHFSTWTTNKILLDDFSADGKCSLPKTIEFFFHSFERSTVFPRFSALGPLPIFGVFSGALNRAGALIKTYENLDLPFPAHTRTLFIIYDN